MIASSLRDISGTHVDVAIIGAGINGASTAQHLSAAGYRVLLVEKGDFSSGATSRSSRLLHCGLRHLASGSNLTELLQHPRNFVSSLATARLDMIARDEIVKTIPHQVKSINFCLPIYHDDPYSPWQIDIAFKVLRMMSPIGVPLEYRRISSKNLQQIPIAPLFRDRAKLHSVAIFREYVFNWPERIALDAVFNARQMGVCVFNYTSVTRLEQTRPKGSWNLTLSPMNKSVARSDQVAHSENVQVSADIVLNLAGPWVDQIIKKTGAALVPKCKGIKGIHIAVQLPAELKNWGVFTFNTKGEPLYCLPMDGIHYFGLTRTPFEGNINDVSATDQEIDWMISETNRCFPYLNITRGDVLFTWAGVNPLTNDPDEPLGSREIKIYNLKSDGLPNFFTLTGAPIMTHRHIAKKFVRIISKLQPPSMATRELKFNSLSNDIMSHPESDDADILAAVREEIERCSKDELPGNLADIMMRRLGLGWTRDQGLSKIRQTAEIAAPILGWSKNRTETEMAAYESLLNVSRRRPGQ